MKKITLVIAFVFAMISQSHAQFSESFEAAALPATWTVLSGGDANTWVSIDLSASTEISGHTGTYVAGIVYGATAHDDYLVTPAITVTAGVNDRLSFWGRSRDPLYPEVIDVVLSTTTATAGAFTTVLQAGVAPASGANFYKYSYDLTAYVGQTIYVGFHSTTTDKFVFDIDDVVSDALPFCSEPIPAASQVGETTATVSWPAAPGAVSYEYVLDENTGDPAGAGTSTTALSYTNGAPLTPATTYYFHIRSNCDGAGFSAWTTTSFDTATPFTGCLNSATFGQWPTATYTPATCNGIAENLIANNCYAGEYSLVNVTAGETYTFKSSNTADLITISTDDGATGAAYGPTPLTWVSTVTGAIRFYTHLDECGEEAVNRSRIVVCGIPACTLPTVTFAKVSNCPTETFNVTANITNLGSATSITVTDNQGSTAQNVTATGLVTFGPYASGLSVTLTVTNDQSTTCTITSAAQTQVACGPANDNFANATAIACGSNYTGNTTNATLDEDNAPDGFGADMDAPNVWYSYTGTGAAQTVTLNLCGSSYDTSVLVYTGTSGNLTLVAGNDDDATCGAAPLNTRSRLSFNSDGTTTYYIAIEGWNAASVGAYTMDVTCTTVTPPAVANQTCGTALGVNVDGFDVDSDNSFGDVSSTQPSCDLFGNIQDVWFSFVAPSATVDVLVTPGTMTSANFQVYGGDCFALTPVTGTCNADLTAATTESLTGLTANATYYVQVWSNAAEQGTFALRLTDPNLATKGFDATNFKAYPNPVKNILNLSYDKAISNVAVFNLLGQEVITKAVNANLSQIDMSHLPSGTYMVKVTADNQEKTIKVVKE